MNKTTGRKHRNKTLESGPLEWVSIRVTADIVPRLHALQRDFAEKTGGGSITQSALIHRGLALQEAANANPSTVV